MRDHRHEFPVRSMCRVLRVHPSGFYARLNKPLSDRAIEDQRLTTLIKASYVASGGTYDTPGSTRICARRANDAVCSE